MSYARQAVTRLTLDMGLPDVQKSVSVTVGDTNRRLEVTLIDRGSPFALPPTWTAKLAGVLPSGGELYEDCIVDDGRIVFDFVAANAVSSEEGVFAVAFDVFDEGGEVVASPKLWVHVTPAARRLKSPDAADALTALRAFVGEINKVNSELSTHTEQIHDAEEALGSHGERLSGLEDKITTRGTITIPANEWTDTLPRLAYVMVDAYTKGTVMLVMPANNTAQVKAREARVRIQAEYRERQICFYRDGDTDPGALTFNYVLLRTNDPEALPCAALVGVDAYGEGGTNTGGVDQAAVEAIVKAIVPEWAREASKPTYGKGDVGLGNVDNAKQYSAENPPPYPVTSVNGKTGAVSLTAGDVKADPAGSAEAVAARVAEDLQSYYTKTEVNGLVSSIPKFSIEAVDSLPTSGISSTTVYLVKDKTSSGDLYTEYIYVGGAWEELGRQTVNLSGYVTSSRLTEILGDYATKSSLPAALNTALAQAEASGTFKGDKGDKGDQGVSGVYVGSGDMPEGYNVQIDPEGEAFDIGDLLGESIPDYWEEHISEKIATIKALQDEGGKDCFSFVVVTDIHHPANLGKRSPAVAKRILDGCDIKYALCLGDVQTRGCHNTKEQVLAENDKIETMLAPIRDRLLQTQGNHDGNYGTLNSETYVYSLTKGEMHSAIYRKVGLVGDCYFDESGTGYYIDDTANKVRYIVLNTHNTSYEVNEDGTQKYSPMTVWRYTKSQFSLLIEALETIPAESWGVVVAAHVPLTRTEIGDRTLMLGVLKAYKDKTTYAGEYEGTASAKPLYTNRLQQATDESGNVYNGTGYKNSSRINSSGVVKDYTTVPAFVTGYIPVKAGQIVRLNGNFINKSDTNADGLNNFFYKADYSSIDGIAMSSIGNAYFTNVKTNDDGYITEFAFNMSGSMADIAYMRLTLLGVGDGCVITVNEPIVDNAHGYDYVSVNTDFSGAKGNLIAYFAGHAHNDSYTIVGDIPVVTTRCDGAEENTAELRTERVKGTVTEQSFDVFTVNKATRTIHATKIGAGADRSIKY